MSVFDLALLGRDCEPQATLAALRLAGAGLGPVTVVSDLDDAFPPVGLPATPAARRMAASLSAEGVPACARGRLALLRPGRDELVRVARVAAARAAGPVVIALSRPRDECSDVLLAESVRVTVLAAPDGPIARLALEQLSAIGVQAEVREPEAGASVVLARLGWLIASPGGHGAANAWQAA